MRRSSRVLALLLLGTILHGPSPAQEGVIAESWAFEYRHDSGSGQPLLDLRYLNEKVAGEAGFIRLSPDGRGFVRGDGKPIRFWAVGTDIYRKSAAELARHARFLAKMGVNMVRLHAQIAPESGMITDVNQQEIDGIWRCVAAMKKEGIYCTISPYWANDKDATKWGIPGYESRTGLWGLLFFNEKLQCGYKSWVKALYARKNTYTGIPLAQDPAVAIIQVQNEDSLLFWTTQGMKPEQQAVLGRLFAKWLVKKYGSLESSKRAWEGTASDKDDFAAGQVGLLNVWHMTQNWQGGLASRVNDECRFYAETQRGFYASIADYYRKTLGCKQLINCCNWTTADNIKLGDIERWTYAAGDVIAVNRYTGGVHIGANNGWRIDPGHHFANQSCLLDPRSFPLNLKQVAGHPMLVTESTWVSPEGFQSEGPFLVAAYESLTGVAGYYWFSATSPDYEPNPYFDFLNLNGQHPLQKWTCSTPMLMGQFPAAALIYRMGYIRRGETVVYEERPMESLWQRLIPIIAEDRSFDPNREGTAKSQSNPQKGIDPLAFLVGPVEVKYGGDAAQNRAADLARFIDRENRVVKSVTGEVSLNYGNGVCTVNTLRAQGASGFLKKAGAMHFADMTLNCANDYAAITVVSMDGKPLNSSSRVLIQVGTYARPTGWRSQESTFKREDGKQNVTGYEIVNTGHPPWRIANTLATIVLSNPMLSKAATLDPAGYKAAEAPCARHAGKLTIELPRDAMYVIIE